MRLHCDCRGTSDEGIADATYFISCDESTFASIHCAFHLFPIINHNAMSNSELIPLFPSATHPAIPIASRILSTLRTLTAPGKGNDIKPEERAALVGVAAVLGCEK